jgi:hypothetical protein
MMAKATAADIVLIGDLFKGFGRIFNINRLRLPAFL